MNKSDNEMSYTGRKRREVDKINEEMNFIIKEMERKWEKIERGRYRGKLLSTRNVSIFIVKTWNESVKVDR